MTLATYLLHAAAGYPRWINRTRAGSFTLTGGAMLLPRSGA
jgi:hypothetical protein